MDHFPVMLPEVLEHLSPAKGGIYVDGTFGAGGYTKAILEQAHCRVVAIDRDPEAQERADKLEASYPGRFHFLRGCFGDVASLLPAAEAGRVDGFVLDLGVSSMQLDQAARGFSFRFDGALDMRMDPQSGGETAADIVNRYREKEIADIIYIYGEERHSRRIAKKILERRAEKPFETTFELADAVRECVPKSRKDEIDPATRTFQALRIKVNDELGELERALESSLEILKPGGRIVVVSFHSLEDRIVKEFFRKLSGSNPKGSRYLPETISGPRPVLRVLTKKSVTPSDEEMRKNPRSRSARLRAAQRLEDAA